jgi:hypothetical protein
MAAQKANSRTTVKTTYIKFYGNVDELPFFKKVRILMGTTKTYLNFGLELEMT